MTEPGLDLHEWATRWSELEEAAAEDAAGSLPEMDRLIEEMLAERGIQLDEAVTEEGEDPDLVLQFLAAREIMRLRRPATSTRATWVRRSRAIAPSMRSAPSVRRRNLRR